ncbi:hypothetical protein F4818DRAFT_88630 [Hypoxylon cercidicola]|nr:hypothetical protein F4818DRAFT_88630 [Hypoxylon cercidicola]
MQSAIEPPWPSRRTWQDSRRTSTISCNPLFDVPGDIEVVFSANISIPAQWDGLIAVLIVVFVDMTCIWTITTLYVRNVRYMRQGAFWHAVSQLIAEPTQSVLQKSDELSDKEIAKLLKGNDPWVTINRSVDTGKVKGLKVC